MAVGGGGGGCGNVMCNLISLSLSLLLSLAWKLIGGAKGIFQLLPANIIIISCLHFSQMNLQRMELYRSLSRIINGQYGKYPQYKVSGKLFFTWILDYQVKKSRERPKKTPKKGPK